jgi:hypothetical protein
MSLRPYLPSGQFILLFSSIFLACGLVYGAQTLTAPKQVFLNSATIPHNPTASAGQGDWQTSLATIQDQSGITAPQPPDSETLSKQLAAAQSSTLTDTVARTLFVNLGAAKSQGLGNDIPTQDQIVAQATAQIKKEQVQGSFSQADLHIVEDSASSQREYGNALATLLMRNKENEYAATMVALDNASASQDQSPLKNLSAIQSRYQGIATQLVAVRVPRTLAPFHLQLVNNFQKIANTYDLMDDILTDTVRGSTGLQLYQSLTQETFRVFINIAQAFNKNGILFKKDEPGAAWAVLLSAQ